VTGLGYTAAAGLPASGGTVAGDVTITGTLRVTPGAVVELGADTNLYRAGANQIGTDDSLAVGADLQHWGSKLGLFGTTAVSKPTVTGSRGGNAALASLLTALAQLGLITDSTTA
jgi:hypothetical protein